MAVFNGVDFVRFDDLLNDEEKTIRQAVRDWVEEKYLPIVEHHYEAATFPMETIPQIAELGLLGANLPVEYGCAGIGDVAYGLAMQELERGDSGLRSFVSVQGALVMYPIFAYGSEEQRKKWLPELASGKKIGCFGLTEPDFGSNPAGMKTTAKTVADGYVLNGAKMWITNGTISDVAIVWARLDGGSIRGFLVE
jgi:glutaryl-CoA dehydrogenase